MERKCSPNQSTWRGVGGGLKSHQFRMQRILSFCQRFHVNALQGIFFGPLNGLQNMTSIRRTCGGEGGVRSSGSRGSGFGAHTSKPRFSPSAQVHDMIAFSHALADSIASSCWPPLRPLQLLLRKPRTRIALVKSYFLVAQNHVC